MNITGIAIAVISLCFAVLTAVGIPFLIKKLGKEKIAKGLQIADEVIYWIKIFVTAAEQLYTKEECETKKAYVEELILKKLEELGLTVDLEVLNAEIEAQVLELHTALKEASK